MSLLYELTEIAKRLKIPASTAVYSGKPPDEYLVFTPLYDSFELHSDNKPEIDVQEVRISLFSKGNYNQTKSRLVKALLNSDITITARKYVGHEDDTSYNHYAIDVAKEYGLERYNGNNRFGYALLRAYYRGRKRR